LECCDPPNMPPCAGEPGPEERLSMLPLRELPLISPAAKFDVG